MISGCTYNTFEDEMMECSVPVSFLQSVSPIIQRSCAVSGCHAGDQPPDWRVFSNIQDKAQLIKIRTQNRTMPKIGTLTQEEIDLIACWVDQGALDN